MAGFRGDDNANFRKKMLGYTTFLALTSAGFFGQALAQDAAQPASNTTATDDKGQSSDDQIIIVRGIKKSIQDTVSAKKHNTSIIEAVSAEDIGKLPDSSIAESIGRLPGIAAQRDKGRAQTLSIRGLGPDFTVTTLNGREQASTNDNRSVEYDQYPSEMIQQVQVYKTPDAGMTYQGIAGTANLVTVRPLSYGHRSLSVFGKYEKNDIGAQVPTEDETGERYSGTYIDQFANKTIGLALSYSHTNSPYQAQTHEPWGYPNCGGQCLAADQNKIIIGGDKSGVQSSHYERDSIMGVLEFQPNDQFHAVLDVFHSDFEELQTIRRLEYGTIWGSGVLQPGYTSNAKQITSGQFNGVTTIVENYNNDRNATIDNIGLNLELKPNDKWTLTADISNSNVDRTDLRLESTAGTGAGGAGSAFFPVVPDNIKFSTNGDNVTTITNGLAVDYSDFNKVYLTDPGGWGSAQKRAGYVGNPTVSDEITALRLSAKRELNNGFFSAVTVGVNVADRTKDKHQFQGELRNKTAFAEVVPTAFRTGIQPTTFWNNSKGMISYDALGLYRSGYWSVTDARVDPYANSGDRDFDYTSTWTVDEVLTTFFIKADIDTTLFGIPTTGNIGVKSVNTDQKVVQGLAGSTAQVHDGATYSSILPSANLIFQLPSDWTLRLAAARTEARPRMDDLAGGLSVGVSSDTAAPCATSGTTAYYWCAGGGNAKLKPWQADAYDISVEKYFSTKGYVSLAAFHKDLKSYIYSSRVTKDFTGFALPTGGSLTYNTANAKRTGVLNAQVNGQGGYIEGYEFTASVPAEILFEPLSGFGLIYSYTHNDSEVKPDGVNATTVPGLSPTVTNTTVYYEKYGFSARVSQRDRDAWLGEVPNFDSSLGKHFVGDETVVDAQIGYDFGQSPWFEGTALKGLSINLSAYNLTDQPFRFYETAGSTTNVLKYENYGTSYLLTVGYRFF